MIEFAENWHWAIKAVIATLVLAGMTVLMIYLQKNEYNYGGPKFLFAWSFGFVVSFLFWAEVSSTMNARDLFAPIGPFLLVLAVGAVFGGVANIWLGQAIPAASNPGLVWAIVGANAPLAYLTTYGLNKAFPNDFPPIQFDWTGLCGIILILIGTVMVMTR